jgi:hypothetical protein
MLKLSDNTTLKRLRNHYRLVIMNDDTYEEVVTFKLSRVSVYVVMSVMFVLMIGVTVALLSFTNLKYLIPGYGTQSNLSELRTLKMQTDSLEQVLVLKQQYLEGMKKAISGDVPSAPKDTTVLKTATTEPTNDATEEPKNGHHKRKKR